MCRRRGVLEGSIKHLSNTDKQSDCNNEPSRLVLKMALSINSMKTNYMVLYDKKKKPQHVQIPIAIDANCLRKFSPQQVLGAIIDE